MKKTILSVFGTRPEAVKMAPIILGLKEHSDEFRCLVTVTAQHRQMLDQVMNLFAISSDHDLDIMKDGQSLTDITVRVLERLKPVFEKERPDLVLVQGDTTTALVATLAAFYQNIPVGHVEAGLRSYDYLNPFPEEANRRLTDALCGLHFAPTPFSKKNLLKENITQKYIFVTGNTIIDALKVMLKRIKRLKFEVFRKGITIRKDRFILVTAHRRENFGQPFQNICLALRKVAEARPDVHLVYPVHLNPQVSPIAYKMLSDQPNIHLLPPLDYGELIYLMKMCYIVLTDSGGIQEEAPSLGKPVLVLRNVTERPEGVRAGTVRLVGTDTRRIFGWVNRLLDDSKIYSKMANAVNPYGDGLAAQRTIEALRYYFGYRKNRPFEFEPKIVSR